VRDGAPLLVILATAAVVNLRRVLYSASMAPYLQHLNQRWQALLAYLLVDETYAVTIARYMDKRHPTKPYAHWYFLGVGMSLWVTWQTSTAIGVFLGAQIPAAWSLDFAMPLTFIAIIVPAIKDRAIGATGLVAGAVALLALAMPLKLGLITAILAGIAVGCALERTTTRPIDPPDHLTTFPLWLTIIGIGLLTFAYRFSLIFFMERIQLPPWIERALRFVPVAALTAITVPELIVQQGALDFTWHNARLLAGIVAVLVAWRTQSVLLTLVLGMGCLYGLQWFFSF